MPEQLIEMKTYKTVFKCEACEDGYMEQKGPVDYTAEPILYPHKCTSCSLEIDFKQRYPGLCAVPVERPIND